MPRDVKTITIQLSPEDHAKLERLAKADDRPLIGIIRKLIREAKEPKQAAE